jgi:hypothetical protein
MSDLILKFKGQDYVLPESRAFEAGEAVEEIATLPEIIGWSKRPQFHKMARCFAALIRLAGGLVSDKDVHAEMMAGFRAGYPGTQMAALSALIEVLMDGAPPSSEGDSGGKPMAAS